LAQVVSAIVFETPPKLSELAADAPEGLEFILHRALEKDPAKRLPHAGDLKEAISLCRVALQLSPRPAAPAPDDAGKTRVIPRATAAATDDEGKTRVMPRAVAAGPAAPPAPADDDKTRVMKRAAPSPVAPPPPPKLQSAAAFQPIPVPAQRFRYCPSCTFANPPQAVECLQCRTPFAAGQAPVASAPKPSAWPLYSAIAVAALLALALVVVLILK
jgi:serine/threonine-protein kinase